MSRYKKYLTVLFLFVFLLGCSSKNIDTNSNKNSSEKKQIFDEIKHNKYLLENQYIIFALEYERQKKFSKARSLYYKLFKETNKYEYFLKFLSLSFLLSDYETIQKYAPNSFNLNIEQSEEIKRFYVLSMIKLKNYNQALKIAKDLANRYKKGINYELLGTVFVQKKEYKRAVAFFEKAYKLNKKLQNLVTISNIKYYYLNKKDDAKEILENYILKNGYNYKVSVELLEFYRKDKNKQKAIKLLKNIYIKYKDDMNVNALKNLLAQYLVSEDVNSAIDFFEENEKDDEVLVFLYQRANEPKKALSLLKKLYKNSNSLEYLAQIAMLEFETSIDKSEVLFDVVRKFEKVLANNNNPTYQNYLAYLLIDYDINIKQGLELVKKALKQDPNNLAFIDTLAWGEYKTNNCTSAFENMKYVVNQAGLDDEEIKHHWDKIKECNK
ncbi:MAG: hypothetical protein ACQERD_02750 [Campylobacterota bacterium]